MWLYLLTVTANETNDAFAPGQVHALLAFVVGAIEAERRARLAASVREHGWSNEELRRAKDLGHKKPVEASEKASNAWDSALQDGVALIAYSGPMVPEG